MSKQGYRTLRAQLLVIKQKLLTLSTLGYPRVQCQGTLGCLAENCLRYTTGGRESFKICRIPPEKLGKTVNLFCKGRNESYRWAPVDSWGWVEQSSI